MAPVVMEEVYQAVHSIGPLKAPGPDGLHAVFYHFYWNQVREPLFKLVSDFFHT
ncbi:hypothetical protein RchiOBHm_Chr7g0205481 [Rosa chinensis]|uniref:RNA-directed DNA polymerase n=1 Tax=Rosa chinensis TaxID=74649 RepID=A0A2P6P906_ROSCH|nr:hypothetical protein RchiOBHm_Chr7g0205481 [Rosa chinensis]